MQKIETMKQIAFAKFLGVGRSYVTQLKQAGRLVMTDKGLVDVQSSLIRLQETADPNRDDVAARHAKERGKQTAINQVADKPEKKKKERDPNQITFADGRAKEQHYRALQAELEYKKTIGELVAIDDMKMAVSDLVMAFRQEAENIPHRISADLVGKDINDIRGILKRGVHDLLANLERGCDAKMKKQEVL